jgi:hypothetical protein
VSGRPARATLGILLAAAASLPAAAQSAPGGRLRPELRLDAFVSRTSAVHLGAGVALAVGPQVRLAAVAAAGLAGRPGDGGGTVGSVRAELVARYLLDPAGRQRRGPYVGGGVGVRRDGGGAWRELLVLVAGIEGPARPGLVPALELGVGGGVRLGVALRRGAVGRR